MSTAFVERRDLLARVARDRLASILDLHPRELGGLSSDLAALLAGKYESAVRDELTGALIRSAGVRALAAEVARTQRSGEPLTVIFVDVTGMKAVNDRSGHAAGDHVLRVLGSLLGKHLRPYDVVVRWGGDEFVVAPGVHPGPRRADLGTDRSGVPGDDGCQRQAGLIGAEGGRHRRRPGGPSRRRPLGRSDL